MEAIWHRPLEDAAQKLPALRLAFFEPDDLIGVCTSNVAQQALVDLIEAMSRPPFGRAIEDDEAADLREIVDRAPYLRLIEDVFARAEVGHDVELVEDRKRLIEIVNDRIVVAVSVDANIPPGSETKVPLAREFMRRRVRDPLVAEFADGEIFGQQREKLLY